MRVMYLDCFSGISGDMIVGALLDAGLEFGALEAAIASLGLPSVVLSAEKVNKAGIMATQFRVLDQRTGRPAEDAHAHAHTHASHHDHHHHHAHGHAHDHGDAPGHVHAHGGHHHHDHVHRHLADVIAIIRGGDLPGAVQEAAIATFQCLAEAEAAVHGMPVEAVHFHEVGAVDSIVDIVAAEFGVHALGVDEVHASALHVGGGTVKCAHGVMPVPAPATARLLRGAPTYGSPDSGELVTPTGAALAVRWSKSFGGAPAMTVDAIGYGSGTRDLPGQPNVLRVQLGELASGGAGQDQVAVLDATLDDMQGEMHPPLLEALFAAGALDAFITPVIGKKGRPAHVVTALAEPARAEAVAEAFFRHGVTFGVRTRTESRYILERTWRTVTTPWGPVRVKCGAWRGEAMTAAPEFEDCRARATDAGVAVRMVYEAAAAAANKAEWTS